jgi:hypothetical protein
VNFSENIDELVWKRFGANFIAADAAITNADSLFRAPVLTDLAARFRRRGFRTVSTEAFLVSEYLSFLALANTLSGSIVHIRSWRTNRLTDATDDELTVWTSACILILTKDLAEGTAIS